MAEFSEKDIEFLFQEEVLDQHGEYLLNLFGDTIQKKKIRESDELLQSLDYKISKSGNDRVLKIAFETYGRFIEIRRHKKQNKFDVNTNQLLWGGRQNTMNKKSKNVDWYSRNAFGSLNRLLSILSNEFSEETIARLKGILENRQTNPI